MNHYIDWEIKILKNIEKIDEMWRKKGNMVR